MEQRNRISFPGLVTRKVEKQVEEKLSSFMFYCIFFQFEISMKSVDTFCLVKLVIDFHYFITPLTELLQS